MRCNLFETHMTAKLELNLSDALNSEELRELTAEAVEQHKPLERILYEAVKEVVRRRREALMKGGTPALSA